MTGGSTATLAPPPCLETERRRTPQSLWQRYHQDGCAHAEEALVHEYLPLVRTIVGRIAMTLPAHVRIDDLQSAGLVGLLQALRNYDPTSAASFETYARNRIRGAVLDELRRMDWVPRSVHDKTRRIEATLNELEQQLGTPPSEVQMANALKISLDEYRRWLDDIRPTTFVSLDSAAYGDGNDATRLHEGVADATQDVPDERVSRRELAQLIAERIHHLPEAQRKVLSLYYYEDMRLKEIAAIFGVTESRISQIHSQAILAIRAYLRRFDGGLY